MSETRLKIAVFIDFDNIEIGVKTTLGGHFDVGAVLEAIKERGEVVTKIAYGDWTRAGDYSRSLTQHAIHMVQRNLTPGGDKNGADINLALDALEMAFTHNHINAFVIVGGDSDFMALVEKLKQYDRKVFVVGGRAFTSVILQKNCTEFIAYENLVGAAPRKTGGRAGGRSGEAPAVQAVPLIRRALKVLADREVSPQLGVLKSTLLQLDSTFSEREYGASTFRDFVQRLARAGYLTLKGTDRNIYVELRDGDSAAAGTGTASGAAAGPTGTAGGGAIGGTRDSDALAAADAGGELSPVVEGELVGGGAAAAGGSGVAAASESAAAFAATAGAGAGAGPRGTYAEGETGGAAASAGRGPYAGESGAGPTENVAINGAPAGSLSADVSGDAAGPELAEGEAVGLGPDSRTEGDRRVGRRFDRRRDARGRDAGGRDLGGRDAGGRDVAAREVGARESGGQEPGWRDAGGRRDASASARGGIETAAGPAGSPPEALRFIASVFKRPGIVSRWPLYLRQVKQILRSVDETFDERRYGFTGIVEALRYCQREGLFRLDRDRQGVLRVYPGVALQRASAQTAAAAGHEPDADAALAASISRGDRWSSEATEPAVAETLDLFPPSESQTSADAAPIELGSDTSAADEITEGVVVSARDDDRAAAAAADVMVDANASRDASADMSATGDGGMGGTPKSKRRRGSRRGSRKTATKKTATTAGAAPAAKKTASAGTDAANASNAARKTTVKPRAAKNTRARKTTAKPSGVA